MATPVTSSETNPPPATQPAVPQPAPAKPIALHPTRPFKYAWSIVKGGFMGVLNGMSGFGSKGFYAGAGLGLLAGIASGGVLVSMAMGAGIGLVGGVAVGAVIGTVTGAYKETSLAHRRDKYSDEVAERQTARAAREAQQPPIVQTGPSWRDRTAIQQRAANYNFERAQQQERENDMDYDRYWQERVDRGHGNGHGKGF